MKILWMLMLSVASFAQSMPQCKPDLSNAPCVVDCSNPEMKCVNSTTAVLVLPDAPKPKIATPPVHSFFDATNVSIFMGSAGAISAETSMSCSQPSPAGLSPKICNQLAVGGALFLTGQVLGAAVLHKTGHHTMERTLTPAVILFHVGRMVWISTHRRQ